jgi:transcriptional regulator with XRE-family HTH domain
LADDTIEIRIHVLDTKGDSRMLLNVDYIEELIRKKGWSERKLAMKAGVSSATISRIITGKRGTGTRSLIGIMKAFPEEPIERLFILGE